MRKIFAILLGLCALLVLPTTVKGKPRVFVFKIDTNLKGKKIKTLITTAIDDITEIFTETNEFEVITQDEVQKLLNMEIERIRAKGQKCANEECMVEIANAISAKYLVFGTLYKLSSKYIISLKILDAYKARAVKRAKEEVEMTSTQTNMNKLRKTFKKCAYKLVEGEIFITSLPTNVQVFLHCKDIRDCNGHSYKSLGFTPIVIKLPAGEAELSFEKVGYLTKRIYAQVPLWKRITLKVKMTKENPNPKSSFDTKQLIGWTAIGIGAASILTGSGLLMWTHLSEWSDFETDKEHYLECLDQLGAQGCYDSFSEQLKARDELMATADKLRTIDTIGYSLLGVGILLAAGGTGILLWAPETTTKTKILTSIRFSKRGILFQCVY